MPTATYDKIQTHTLPSNAATVTFTPVPGTYTDLVLVGNVGAAAAGNVQIRFNGDASAIYGVTALYAYGTTASSGGYPNLNQGYVGPVAASLPFNITSSFVANIFDYKNTTKRKTVLSTYGQSSETNCIGSTWRSTAAITSIELSSYSANFLAGSTFTLYGILRA